MTIKHWFRIAALPALACVLAIPVPAGDQIRVGDFYMEIAKLKGVGAGDGAAAERGLRRLGIGLPALDLTKVMTEGDLVRISEALGVHVRSQRSDAAVSPDLVTGYTRSFREDLRRKHPAPPPSHTRGNDGRQGQNCQDHDGDDHHSRSKPCGDGNNGDQNNQH